MHNLCIYMFRLNAIILGRSSIWWDYIDKLYYVAVNTDRKLVAVDHIS